MSNELNKQLNDIQAKLDILIKYAELMPAQRQVDMIIAAAEEQQRIVGIVRERVGDGAAQWFGDFLG